jgi:glycine hydroxymethyltransferase
MSMLKQIDPEVAAAILEETKRQAGKLELIPSENFVDEAVLEAQGSIMTNKYAEGYPGKRYYHGCEFVDVVEALAIERAKKLFGADHANVQAHSGSQANMAVYFAVLQPGDTILGMNLAHGGHLSHGSPANFSGRFYKVVSYGVDPKTERIDFNEVEEQAKKHKPKVIVVGASAYSRDIPFEPFRQIADQVGAVVLADIAKALDSRVFPGMQGGPLMHIIAAKAVALKEALTEEFKQYQIQIQKNARTLAETLMAEGFRLVSGGTDNHLMLIDVTSIGVTGAEGADALDRAGITTNKNMIPFDTRGPMVTSGIRVGTPAITSRGMKEAEMKLVGRFISTVLKDLKNESTIGKVRKEVGQLCERFPLYADRIARG